MNHIKNCILSGTALLTFLAEGYANDTQQDPKPNVVLIIIDDLGYGQMSCYPHFQDVHTPNLDALAERGIRMTQGYSNDPMCAPTRKSLRSGMYYQASIEGEKKDAIGRYFKENNYRTACIGKSQFSRHPMELGFDEFFGFQAGLHDYYESRIPTVEEYSTLKQLVPKMGVEVSWGEGGLIYNIQRYSPILHNHEPIKEFEYLTTEFTNRAIDWISEKEDDPFFLYLSYNAVHHPHQAPEIYMKKRDPDASEESAEAQLAQLDCLDDEIGRLLSYLQKTGKDKNTLIMVVSDNGGLSFEGANWELRGHKSQLYEGGIRVPWIVSWPDALPQGKIFEQPVIHMDIVPTLLDAADIQPGNSDFDGKSLLPYLRDDLKGSPHEVLFWGARGNGIAVRKGDWKYVEFPGNDPALFNLSTDVSESQNLIDSEPGIAEELKKEIADWKAKKNIE